MRIIAADFERIVLTEDEQAELVAEEAQALDQEIRKGHPQISVDDQVDWNYFRSWRSRAKLRNSRKFGSDYDYWNEVADDALQAFATYSANAPRDYIADSKAGVEGYSKSVYTSQYFSVWDAGRKVPWGTKLEGPYVDVGPNADFSVFLEQWDRGTLPNRLRIFREIGVIHAIARDLASVWAGVHVIYPMTVAGGFNRSATVPTPNRQDSVNILPVIRIRPWHYQKG